MKLSIVMAVLLGSALSFAQEPAPAEGGPYSPEWTVDPSAFVDIYEDTTASGNRFRIFVPDENRYRPLTEEEQQRWDRAERNRMECQRLGFERGGSGGSGIRGMIGDAWNRNVTEPWNEAQRRNRDDANRVMVDVDGDGRLERADHEFNPRDCAEYREPRSAPRRGYESDVDVGRDKFILRGSLRW